MGAREIDRERGRLFIRLGAIVMCYVLVYQQRNDTYSIYLTLRERKTHRQTDRQTNRQAGRQAGRQTDRQTDRQADRLSGRQAGRKKTY